MDIRDIKEGGVYRVVHRDDINPLFSDGSVVKVRDISSHIQGVYVDLLVGNFLHDESPKATIFLYPSELEEIE